MNPDLYYCAANGIDPEIFYPHTTEQHDGTAKDQYSQTSLRAARTFCALCPMKEACLWEEYDIGLRVEDLHGVRGGMTAIERQNLYAQANARQRATSND